MSIAARLAEFRSYSENNAQTTLALKTALTFNLSVTKSSLPYTAGLEWQKGEVLLSRGKNFELSTRCGNFPMQNVLAF